MEIKVINNVWYHIDDAHPNGLNWSDWDCQFDSDANTFVLIFPNNSSFPKKSIPSLDITVTSNGVSNSYPTVALLRARLLQLNYPPLVGSGIVTLPDGIEINKGLLNPTTTTITAPTNTETHFYRIIANGTVNGTLPVNIGDIVGINSTSLWLESNNNQLSIIDKGYITIVSPVQLVNSVNAQPIFNKVFKAKPNTRYEYKLIIFCTDLSGSQNILLGFNNSQNTANPLNGITANMFQGNAARGSVTTGFSSFSITTTEIVVTGISSDTRFNCGLRGTLTTGNAPSGLTFCDIIPIIKTPVSQANAFISRAYFTIEEVGNNTDMFKGNFQ